MTTPAPIPLPYGRHSAVGRRVRSALMAVVLLGTAAAAWYWFPRIHRYLDHTIYVRENHRWYATARTWSQPPDTLKYTENPADAPPGGFALRYRFPNTPQPTGYQSFGGAPVEKMPVLITGGRHALVANQNHGHLFMHERTTTGQRTRLLVVHQPGFDGNVLMLRVDQIGLHRGSYRTVSGSRESIDMTGIAGPGEIRLYAGQPDPNDPSRFTIPFEARGRRGHLVGAYASGPPAASSESDAIGRLNFTIRMEGAAGAHPTTQTTMAPG